MPCKMPELLLTAIILIPHPFVADHARKIEKQARKVAGEQVVLVRPQSGHQMRGRAGPYPEPSFTLPREAGHEELFYQDMRSIQEIKPLPAFGQPGIEVTLPYGTAVSLALQSGLSSQTIKKGAIVPVVVTEPVVVQGRTVIAQGTVTQGRILQVHRAGRFYASGLITLEVAEVAAVDGTPVPLLYRTTRGTKQKDAPWVKETLTSPLMYAFMFTIPVMVAVASAQKGDVLELPASTSFTARVGLPARDLDAARKSVARAARGAKETRFPLWLDRPAFLSGILLERGRYTAAVVDRDAWHGDLYLFSGTSISRKSLAASGAVDLESAVPDSPSGVSYMLTAGGGIRIAEIRLAARRWVIREPAIIVRVEGGAS